MIQIGLKPLTRLGLNTSALILVRDQRHNKFEDSLLGIVEFSFCEGPTHFSCFPNFPIWSQVTLPEIWKMENIAHSLKEESRKLESTVQYVDGDVEIKFSSQRHLRIKLLEESRNSTSSITDFEKISISGLQKTNDNVSHPEYKVDIPESSTSKFQRSYFVNNKKSNSLTFSDMCYSYGY